mgnify:CR=1 FL=1
MAFSPAQKYPGATEADPNYQDTKFKDNNPATVPNGSPLKAIDRNELLALQEAIMNEAGFEYNGVLDTPQDSQLFAAYQAALSKVEPISNDWNGYFDPEHQDQLPSPTGYPADSGSGGTVYGAGDQWSLNCFSSTAANTISSDVDGVIFSGSIEKRYEFTPEQIAKIDENKIAVYIKDQDGKEYFFKNGDTGVTVGIAGTTLTVTLSNAIFTVTGIAKIWRFFVTESVGRVVELSVDGLAIKLSKQSGKYSPILDLTSSRVLGVKYENNSNFTRRIYVRTSFGTDNDSSIFINDIEVGRHEIIGSNSRANFDYEIEPNWTYRVESNIGLDFWREQ